ncbi:MULTISPECIES: helix-turn-helix domain-containing protein [unclassified Rhizobium]|uniref:helix-turn-helix domain-containing protein n=1 Tax=unclassified Rhizobium TaxID=2613769 RepID=UPI0021F7356C|nr:MULTISPECIES: helix-turn-helix domain-containing protein [unclassified Rhizobium]MCV9943978.1 helix-turn-helix domain-containing protein [Rhizobium sp. BT-175]MCW0017543.1 helix-turn-helix domain-containing protein [Rhizobium sp. BT-226]
MAGPVARDNRRIEILASVQARYADFDMMAASAIGWDQKYDHIGRGRFEGSLSMVVLNTLQIGRERWNPGIMQRGSSPARCWFVGLPIAADGSLHVRGRQIASGQPVLAGPCDDIAFIANGNADLAQAVIPVDQIEHWMQVRRGSGGLDRKYLDRPFTMSEQEIVRRGTVLARLLQTLLRNTGDDAQPDALAAIEGQIVDVVLGMVPSTEVAEPLHRRARVAMKLRDMLMGHIEAPLNVSAMCETLGVRERTLYLACVEAFGRPPKAMLLELRLNAVRRALTHPSAERTVTSVASRFGFGHFGEFSGEYRRKFGELPSATLTNTLGTSQGLVARQRNPC